MKEGLKRLFFHEAALTKIIATKTYKYIEFFKRVMAEYLVRCQVCNRKIAKNVCKKCGRNVCEDHYDPLTGICTACRQGKIV